MKNNEEYTEQSKLMQDFQKIGNDTLLIRKLICYVCSQNNLMKKDAAWDNVLLRIFEVITTNKGIGNERTLLASQAFFALLSAECTSTTVENSVSHILRINISDKERTFSFLDREFIISDITLFKLIIAHGYLQLRETGKEFCSSCVIIFEILYEHCIMYSRYSYFAYKVLHLWLSKTMVTDFWKENDLSIEKKLESIIFSNWCNAISDVSKQNAVGIFHMYLKIMERKYENFLKYIFERCVDDMSWQHEVKYIILAEICNVWNDITAMTSRNVILSLFTCLTKNYLRQAGTKVYMTLLRKLDEDNWKRSFGEIVKSVVRNWESKLKKNHDGIQLLCKFWLEPTMKKYKNILPYLWSLCSDFKSCIFQSHLQRMASEMRISLPENFDPVLYMDHKDEIVRLNGFAVCCNRVDKLMETNEIDPCQLVKQFLWYNANTTSTYLREGIVKYFEVFYINLLKLSCISEHSDGCIRSVIAWIHEFILDCFEIGSCYQRKILGLHLYEIVLSFANESSRQKKAASKGPLQKEHLLILAYSKFVDKRSILLLLRLILDTALDVKEMSSRLIVNNFDTDILTDSEKKILFDIAFEYCNSSKFYEIESGAIVMKILAKWIPAYNLEDLNTCCEIINTEQNESRLRYSEFLLRHAQSQLMQMKEDTLKAIVRNMPFYGVLHALLKIGFQRGPENQYMTVNFTEKLLNLLEDAVNFFLSILSSKTTDTEYSSSFAEMGLAIDEAIKTSGVDDNGYDELNLSPAHRVILSCIWMSLKVSCDISCEIGMLMYSPEDVHRALDLIARVLLKCRHKGAVEAAGSAIGSLARCLHNRNEYCELPRKYIAKLLEKDGKSTLNLTRRGAGLSIMFHRLVVSDNRRDRPLVHLAVNALLQSLEEINQLDENLDCQHDSPTARHLHFLRALVADKEIHAHLVPYMERISLLCFKYLQSKVWVIRNASLQLFGAVLPRLVGQTTGGRTLSFGTGYSFDHFVTHYPILADHVMRQLQDFSHLSKDYSAVLCNYSSIVHVLILLSKMFCGDCEFTDYSSELFVKELRYRLPVLLANPVAHIRALVAKVYAAATAFTAIRSEVNRFMAIVPQIKDANLTHGYLLAVFYLKQKLDRELESMGDSKIAGIGIHCRDYEKLLKDRCGNVVSVWKGLFQSNGVQPICYVSETMFFRLFDSKSVFTEMLPILINSIAQKTFKFSSERVKPGFSEFVDLLMEKMASCMNFTAVDDKECVNNILNSQRDELIISFLNHATHCPTIFEIILTHLLLQLDTFQDLVVNAVVTYIIKCLKELSPDTVDAKLRELSRKLIVEIEKKKISRPASLVHLKDILLARFCEDEEILSKIFSRLLDLCVDKEEEVRCTAAECIELSLYRFDHLSETNKNAVIHCCLILLKDESFEIRESIAMNLRAHVLLDLKKDLIDFQHNEAIFVYLLLRMIPQSLPKNMRFLQKYTKDIRNVTSAPKIENPFEHNDESLYREETKFLNIFYLKIQQENSDPLPGIEENSDKKFPDIDRAIDVKYDIQKEIAFNSTNLQQVLNIKHMDYLMQKLRLLKHLNCANN